MTEVQKTGRLRPLLSGVLLRSQTDERLAALAGAGNQPAFNVIYERYRRELSAHARQIVRPDRADDVVQHAMLAVWDALLAGTEISDLRAWLHRVTHNAALDTISRRGYDDADIPGSSIAASRTDELAEGRLGAASALAALAALPESQRRALTLTALEGRSGHDAAVEMGISESAMRQLVYRARSSVRSAVTAITPVPLIDWLVSAGAAPATPAAISLGAAGGAAATLTKVLAVVGVTAATFGAARVLRPPHHPRRHAANVTITHTATTTADGGASETLLRRPVPAAAQPVSATNTASGKRSDEQHQDRGQTGHSRHGAGNGNKQSGSGSRSGSGSGSGSGSAGGGAARQAGARQQSGAGQHDAITQSSTNDGSQSQQSSQATAAAQSAQAGTTLSSGTQSGDATAGQSSADQSGQSGGGNQ